MLRKTPFEWVNQILRKIQNKQKEISRCKIKALQNKAYDYYLTIYLQENAGKVDFHPDLYIKRRVVCIPALKRAKAEIKRITGQGQERINQCYKILRQNARETQKELRKRA